jgi:hypothetical protein
MTRRVSRVISVGRDNIVRYASDAEFFTKNPGLQSLQPQFDECRAAYAKSGAEKGCSCRADASLLIPCITAFIQLLLTAKEDNPTLIQDFIKYVAKTDDIENTGVTIYFRALDGSTELTKYEFP